VLEIMMREAGTGLTSDCLHALTQIAGISALPRTTTRWTLPAAAVVPALSEDYTQAA
jgi:hypothetical protein